MQHFAKPFLEKYFATYSCCSLGLEQLTSYKIERLVLKLGSLSTRKKLSTFSALTLSENNDLQRVSGSSSRASLMHRIILLSLLGNN